jgi:UDP-2,3-diacylglucosamine pyrophosphatase LpxH
MSPNPRRTKRIFISDVHINAGRSFADGYQGHPYDWLNPDETKRFAGFLSDLSKREDISEVILLGDIFEEWVCPVDDVPPTLDEIVAAPHNKEAVEQLNALSQHPEIKVVYLSGNHDMSVDQTLMNRHFPKIVFGGSAWHDSRYQSGRVLAEHGSARAMFNAPDPANDARSRLPLGYFISRVVTTKAARTGHADRHFWTYIDDALELLGPQSVAASVFETLLEEADLPEETPIEMRPIGGQPRPISAAEVKSRYANLYQQWEERKGRGMAFKSLMAEIGYLGDFADHLSKSSGNRIIIFGHNHSAELDKDTWFVENRIYANCGTWIEAKQVGTFVEIEREGGEYAVRLCQWRDDKTRLLKEESLKL